MNLVRCETQPAKGKVNGLAAQSGNGALFGRLQSVFAVIRRIILAHDTN